MRARFVKDVHTVRLDVPVGDSLKLSLFSNNLFSHKVVVVCSLDCYILSLGLVPTEGHCSYSSLNFARD